MKSTKAAVIAYGLHHPLAGPWDVIVEERQFVLSDLNAVERANVE
jgi:hypothetical protein